MKLVQALQTKDTLTENLMPTHSTSNSACLDFFGCIGSARNWQEQDIINVFVKALEENPLTAMRTLFWARDVRGGAGERRVFRVCAKFLDNKIEYRDYIYTNLHLIPFYGRWDDVFVLDDPIVFGMISDGLENCDGLLAKWLPRKGKFASRVKRELGFSAKEYRKVIVGLTDVVESKMCKKQWEGIKYEHVPAVAFHKYRKAFKRNDESRFEQFVQAVKQGEKEIKAGTLFPYQLYQAFIKNENYDAIEAQWMNMPDYMKGNKERVLPVCDTSGSMESRYGGYNATLTPMDISVSLGVYISERNKGAFKDVFVTFSREPRLQQLKGSVCSRFGQLQRADWGMNTDIEKVFKLVLSTGIKYNVPEKQMPTMVLIISDMQFDAAVIGCNNSALEMIKKLYNGYGYKLPKIVFWNVNARVGQIPVKAHDKNTAIVSGCSPAILKNLLSGVDMSPVGIMNTTVHSERYQQVKI